MTTIGELRTLVKSELRLLIAEASTKHDDPESRALTSICDDVNRALVCARKVDNILISWVQDGEVNPRKLKGLVLNHDQFATELEECLASLSGSKLSLQPRDYGPSNRVHASLGWSELVRQVGGQSGLYFAGYMVPPEEVTMFLDANREMMSACQSVITKARKFNREFAFVISTSPTLAIPAFEPSGMMRFIESVIDG